MKLVIDGDAALRSNIGQTFDPPDLRFGNVIIALTLDRQENSNWCWAAIACALGRHYRGPHMTQAEMAARVLGASHAEDNVETRLDPALEIVGCYSHWSPGKPTLDRIRFEINQGRPLAARIGWHDGAGHYVVVHGYAQSGDSIHIADPLYGPDVLSLHDFPKTYRKRGAWTETFWTRPAADTASHERIYNGGL